MSVCDCFTPLISTIDSMDLDDERKMVDMNGGSSNTLISSNIDLKMFAGREDEEEGKSASDEPVPSIPFEILDDLFDCLKKSGLSSESFPVFNSLFGILDQGSSNWSQCFNEEIEGYGGVAEGGLLRRSATDTTISSYLSNSDAGEASAGVKPGNNVSDARVSNLKKLVKLQKYYEEYRILLDKTSSMRGTVARNRRIYKE